MLRLNRISPYFAQVERPVSLATGWPENSLSPQHEIQQLAGPVILDLYSMTPDDKLVQALAREGETAGRYLADWSDEEVRYFRSSIWRSAHHFVVENISLVDRGRELDELARLLKVKR